MAKRKNTNRENTGTADTGTADARTTEVSTLATVDPTDKKVSVQTIAELGAPAPQAASTADAVGMSAVSPQPTSPQPTSPDAADGDAADGYAGAQILNWFLPEKLYQMLKWLTLTVLPALAVLVGSIGPVWSLPHSHAIITTISAVSLFLGSIIGISEIKARILSPPNP